MLINNKNWQIKHSYCKFYSTKEHLVVCILPGNEGSRYLWNVSMHLRVCMVMKPRRQLFLSLQDLSPRHNSVNHGKAFLKKKGSYSTGEGIWVSRNVMVHNQETSEAFKTVTINISIPCNDVTPFSLTAVCRICRETFCCITRRGKPARPRSRRASSGSAFPLSKPVSVQIQIKLCPWLPTHHTTKAYGELEVIIRKFLTL
jgi:hypothetical protein